MPQLGLHCVKGDVPHAECQGCALNPLHPCMLTPDLLQQLRERRSPNVVFSPTRVLGCHRRQVLEKTVPYYTDVEKSYALLRGTITHAMAEDLRYPGAYAVLREKQLWLDLETKYGTTRFESTPDLVVVTRKEGNTLYCKVVDFKTKGYVPAKFDEAYAEHVAQVNMYAWLVTRSMHTHFPGADYTFVVEEVEVQYLGSNKPRRFTSAGSIAGETPLPLLPLDVVERSVVREVEKRLARGESLPPMLPESQQWKCDWCPVREACFKARDEECTE